ncbi:cation/H+ exchanger protein 1 isoform X2 [Epinephelus lanceolatus]|uniref:cation/H+ exchanger protein 1 isoform X2 n=1 Tax=Epinephelus lanceolatus TaxID=310571 RepID=UPI0014454AE6|nr:cation/H+ exchanger protein 1 isoform X2 [Epinephelus lanceolatus]
MSHKKSSLMPGDVENLRRRSTPDSAEISADPEQHPRFPRRQSQNDWLCVGPQHPELGAAETPSPDASARHFCHYTPKCFLTVHRGGQGTTRSTPSRCGDEGWHEGTTKTTIRAENEVEAHREANNYKAGDVVKRSIAKPPKCEVIPEESDTENSKDHVRDKDSAPLLMSSPIPVEIPVPEPPARKTSTHWCRISTYVWLVLGYPVMAVVHSLACVLSWLLVFSIPVAKMNARTLTIVLLMAPEDIHIHRLEKTSVCETRVILCCYQAFNVYFYKYTVQGISIFALNLLPLVLIALIIGYTDQEHSFCSAETKFATAIASIIPLSYYIGMGIASLSAQSNFAVGAVVNATFGSITEMTFYITALLRGHSAASKCYEEVVKAALTGTLLGCILFIPGICMIIGGIRHREQRFNSRSAGVSSALLFISVGGVFAPTLFSKTFGNLVCESCTNIPGNGSVPFICKDCHYDTSQADPQLILSQIEPLVYTISVLLPAAYLIGLIFTLKTHSHIYDIHISDGQGGHAHGHHVVHWSRWRALAVLIVATVLMACCADLSTENIEPMLTHSSVSQYFIGVTVMAMVPELPEIVNGIQFAVQNNISLSLEVGSCIAVQVCMIQIPLLILFNAFYDVGFVLVFSDIHLWASIFSVILVNYIFMDGKCDYFQGTALVVVYLILLALYFFAPSPRSCRSPS